MSKFALTAELNLQIPKTKVNSSLRGLKKSLKDIGSVDLKLNTKGAAKSVRELKKKLKEIGTVQVNFTGLKNARKFASDIKKHLKSVDVEVNLKLPKNLQSVQKNLTKNLKPVEVPVTMKDAAKSSAGLQKISKEAANTGKAAIQAATGFQKMEKEVGRALVHIAKFDAARRIFYGFVSALEQGISDAIEFEREMVKVAQVANTTLGAMKGLEQTISNLATKFGVASNTLAKTALILKQTGLSIKEVQTAMDALAKTELAPTFDNLTNTTEAAVAAMRQFGIEAAGLEGLLGKINVVAGNFAVESGDIGQAIIRTGGAFKAAGGNVEELIALFTSVRATTRETAETIATGFRTIFTRLQRPKTIEFLRSFGIELTDLSGKFVGPYEAINRLSNALSGLDTSDLRFSAIVEQLGGFRQVSKVIPLIKEFETAQAALMAQQMGANSLAEDANAAQASLAVQLAKVKEEFKELGREIVGTDSFQLMAKGAIALAKAIADVGKAIAPLIPLITALGALKIGKIALGAGANLAGNLGGVNPLKMSSGGWVPGRGNSDTVPAMLTPGEFVLRKSAAQAFGPALNDVNKYAGGGPVLAKVSYGKTHDGDSYIVNATPSGTPYSTSSRLDGWDAPELPSKEALQDWKDLGNKAKDHPGLRAKAIAQKHMKRGKHFNNMFFDDKNNPYGFDTFKRPMFKDPNLVAELKAQGLGVPMKGRKRLNKGGLVPSLLTPGEFVVNKKAAQSIGYGNLTKMNNVKKFNKGGGPSTAAIGGGAMGAMGGGSLGMLGFGAAASAAKDLSGGLIEAASGALFFYTAAQAGGAAIKNMIGDFANVGGELLNVGDGIDAVSRGIGAIGALSAGASKAADTFEKLYGKDDPLTKAARNRAEGGVLGAGAVARKNVAVARQQEARKQTDQFKEQFREKSSELKERGSKASELREQAKAQQQAIKDSLKEKGAAAGVKLTKNDLEMFTGERGGPLTSKQKEKMGALGEAGLGKTVEGMKAEMDQARRVQKEQLSIQRSSAGLLKKEEAIFKTGLKERVKNNVALKKEVIAKEKAVKRMKMAGAALQIAVAAVGVVGDKMKAAAMKQIAEGDISDEDALVQQAGIGGAMSGAASGAQAGAMFGPWGMAIGAAVGGIWGFVNATKEAEKALRARKLEDATKDAAEAMQKFSDGAITAEQASIRLADSYDKQKQNNQDQTGEQRLNARKQQQANVELLAKSQAKAATSIREFDAALESNLRRHVEEGTLRESVIKKLRSEIEARLEAQKKLNEQVRIQKAQDNLVRSLNGLSIAFEEAANRQKTTMDIIDGISNPLSSSNFGGGLANAIRPESGDKASIDRMEKVIDSLGNVAGESVGASFGRFGGQAKEAAFLERNLKDALAATRERATGGLGGEGIGKELMAQLTAAQAAEGREGQYMFEGGAFQERLQKTMATLPEDLVRDLQGDDLGKQEAAADKIQEILQGSSKQFLEGFQKIAKLTDEHTKRLQSAFDARTKLELEQVGYLQAAAQQRFDAEEQFAKNISVSQFGGTSNEKVQANFRQQQGILLGSAGLDTGMAGNVTQLSAEFQKVSRQLIKARETSASQGQGGGIGTGALADSQYKLVEGNSKLQKQYQVLKKALEANTNSTQRLSALQESLKREQEKQKTLEQLTFDAAYGTAEEKDSAARLINAVNTAIQAGSVTAVAPELQRQVANLLPQVAGQEGEDIRRKGLNKFLGTSGSAPTAAGGVDFQGITAASEKQIEIATQIQTIQLEAAEAQKALADESGIRINDVTGRIADLQQQFTDDLRELLQEVRGKQLEADTRVTETKGAELDRRGDASAAFGLSVRSSDEKGNQARAEYSQFIADEGNVRQYMQAQAYAQRVGGTGGITGMAQGENMLGGAGLRSLVDEYYSLRGTHGEGTMTKMTTAGKNKPEAIALKQLLGGDTGAMHEFMMAEDKDIITAGSNQSAEKYLGQTFDAIRKQFEGQDFDGMSIDNIIKEAIQSAPGEDGKTSAVKIVSQITDLIGKAEKNTLTVGSEQGTIGRMKEKAFFDPYAGRGEQRVGKIYDVIAQGLLNQGDARQDPRFIAATKGMELPDAERAKELSTKTDELAAEVSRVLQQALVTDYSEFKSKTEAVKQERQLLGENKDQMLQTQPQDAALDVQAGLDGSAVGQKQKEAAEAMLHEGSIFTHDVHCEAILERIAVALEGGGGTASNPASETTGSVAFTQTLDSSGFQDGVDKFSKTVDSLREVMTQSLNVEIGGTVTVDVNLKEGAAFLNDSKNAIGMMVSQKINGAINNFIKNGLKDARVNTGNWDDSEATPLANNGGY